MDNILLTSYEVRSRSPGQISCSLSISVSLSVGNHGMCLTLFSCCCFLEFCVSPRHSPHPPHHLYGTGWLGAQQYGAEGAALSSQPSPGPPDSLNGAEGAALGSQSEPSTSYI